MSIAPGTRLGQYQVQDFIGQGAMGLVYRAYHAELERTGAVKVMQAITPDADTVARFRHEAQAIAKMRHPNIVDVYDFGEFEGTPYMIVEYVPGGNLATRMAHGPLDRYTALRYLRGVAAGLDYAHAHGVVHRDVKPANVLLSSDDTPVLADFGLAKLLQGSSLKSMTGVTTGTPAYMAPEQVTGRQVGPAADRYSLATIAYEMLTGVIPFDGEALMELLYAQVHREPVPPSSRYPDLGPAVDAVIMRGLAKDPAARWVSCGEFVNTLAEALGEAVPAGVTTRSAAATTVVIEAPMPSTVPIAAGAAVVDRAVAKPRRPATVAVAFPSPPEHAQAPAATTPIAASNKPVLTRPRVAVGLAAVMILLLVLGVCAVAAQATSLVLAPSTSSPGEVVDVIASNVPAHLAGLIELHSIVHTYPFRADPSGKVNLYINVPKDIDTGDHTVKICWNETCHASATLHVVSALALASRPSAPTPGVSPVAGGAPPSSTPGTGPTAGPTARPTANPTSYPAPTSPPTSQPTTPPPTVNPCPGNSNAPSLTPQSQSVVGGNAASFTGASFTPNSNVTLSYYSPQGSATPSKTWSVKASCQGTFSTSVTTKTGVIRTHSVVACDVDKGCVTARINILL
ncbi:MAG TPA: protein kinase [Candidatus Dormibacteraeota bacterium]|nr:protein kinase [Candidatus Dormibacteraeota bacterium]